MTLKQHTIQASAGSIILAPLLGFDTVVFFFSMILIDVDHYFDFAIVCRRFGIKDMFKYHKWVWHKRASVYGLSVFHTAEVFLALFILGFWSYYFWIVLSGFFVHLMFDFYSLYKDGNIFNRAISIIEYIMRRSSANSYPVPEKDFWD